MANDTYLIDYVQFALEGLDLHRSEERIPKTKVGRMVNVHRPVEGYITTRPGQALLGQASSGNNVHSVRRLNDPKAGTFTRIWGIDTDLYKGAASEFTLLDSGYSGEPMHLVRHRPTVSGQSWMFVGDKKRMRKARADGLVMPIGLRAPTSPATTSLVPEQRTVIDLFQTNEWTDIANIGPFSLEGESVVVGGPAGTANAVEFKMVASSLSGDPDPPDVNNYMWWTQKFSSPLNLNVVGSREATDDDMIHIQIRVADLKNFVDLRIYFVLEDPFVEGQFSLPGTNNLFFVGNFNAYLKVFRRHDFEGTVQVDFGLAPTEVQATATAADDNERQRDDEIFRLTSRDVAIRREQYEAKRQVAAELPPGLLTWAEFGVVDVPLRRGDFIRLGGDSDLDWGRVTGLVILVNADDPNNPAPGPGDSMTVSFANWYLHGGYGIDNADPGDAHYDWRYTHFDPRTAAESNPSPIMDEDDRVDTARRAVDVDPLGYRDENNVPDTNIRQRIYRRGGSNVSDWRFVGTTATNGGFFTDEASDASIIASAPVDLDNDQPVTTIDQDGNTVLAQPVPVLFGPVSDILMALGDPERPGFLYWSKPGEPDHWPPQNNVEVCDPSEELMTGVVFGDLAYAFSRERMYRVLPSLSGRSGIVVTTPTSVKHGVVSRHSAISGGGAIWFLSEDGLYVTTGGEAVNVSDPDVRPLFEGRPVRGYDPIDFSAPTVFRVTYHDNDVYILYRDRGGVHRVLIYSAIFKYWRWYDYANQPSVIYADEGAEV